MLVKLFFKVMYQFFEFLHFYVFSANVERLEQNKFQGSGNRTNSSVPRQPEKDTSAADWH